MAINYSMLTGSKSAQGSIKNWVNAENFDVDMVLLQAEQKIYEKLRVRGMMANSTDSMSIGDDTITLPSRWRGNLHLMFTGTDKAALTLKTPEDVEMQLEWDAEGDRERGKPRFYYPTATVFQLDVEADKAYGWRCVYYAALAPLASSDSETNMLTDRYPRLLQAACMMQANEFLKNPGEYQHWMLVFEDAIQEANAGSDLELIGLEADVG